jgi:hypothetical protein
VLRFEILEAGTPLQPAHIQLVIAGSSAFSILLPSSASGLLQHRA